MLNLHKKEGIRIGLYRGRDGGIDGQMYGADWRTGVKDGGMDECME